jgi:hypothetical protein
MVGRRVQTSHFTPHNASRERQAEEAQYVHTKNPLQECPLKQAAIQPISLQSRHVVQHAKARADSRISTEDLSRTDNQTSPKEKNYEPSEQVYWDASGQYWWNGETQAWEWAGHTGLADALAAGSGASDPGASPH